MSCAGRKLHSRPACRAGHRSSHPRSSSRSASCSPPRPQAQRHKGAHLLPPSEAHLLPRRKRLPSPPLPVAAPPAVAPVVLDADEAEKRRRRAARFAGCPASAPAKDGAPVVARIPAAAAAAAAAAMFTEAADCRSADGHLLGGAGRGGDGSSADASEGRPRRQRGGSARQRRRSKRRAARTRLKSREEADARWHFPVAACDDSVPPSPPRGVIRRPWQRHPDGFLAPASGKTRLRR